MGQIVAVESVVHGEVAVFDTDRTFTGQDGREFTRPVSEDSLEARLAKRLFEADPAIRHVYVQFNVLSVQRNGGWDEGSVRRAGEQIRDFFVVTGAGR
ncbi:hypothetical protein BMS3Abin02_01805 [bacterium BMS3Abin02]|nr:hypothetical protein BMS3Abin02_01805 [bacterium BMS3Abin02]GBE22368.1 hypothetical protein BMS3Bbin01_01742 [bacterium BMS3Bbin01]HDL48857.1 hypothetical protein [Actinomycetota bacterium]